MASNPLPVEWEPYMQSSGKFRPLEIVTWVSFDTQWYQEGVTTFLDFFQSVSGNPIISNMYMPGMFPTPQALLVERVMIDGLTTPLIDASMDFTVGAKRYFTAFPAVHAVLARRGFLLRPQLLIGSLCQFSFRLSWPELVHDIGRNILGQKLAVKKIRVSLAGQLARPV